MADDKCPLPEAENSTDTTSKHDKTRRGKSTSKTKHLPPSTPSTSSGNTGADFGVMISELRKINAGLTDGFSQLEQKLDTVGYNEEEEFLPDYDPHFEEEDFTIPPSQNNNQRNDPFEDFFENRQSPSSAVENCASATTSNEGTSDDGYKQFRENLGLCEDLGRPIDNNLADIISGLFDFSQGKSAGNAERTKIYKKPENCNALNVPELNKVIWNTISGYAKNSDKAFQKIQCGIIKSATAITQALELIFQKKTDKDSIAKMQQLLGDAVAMLGCSNRDLVQKRKDSLRCEMRPDYRPLCSQSSVSTPELLFGDDLVKNLRDIGTVTRIGQKAGLRRGGYRFNPYTFRGRGRGRYRDPSYFLDVHGGYKANPPRRGQYERKGRGRMK